MLGFSTSGLEGLSSGASSSWGSTASESPGLERAVARYLTSSDAMNQTPSWGTFQTAQISEAPDANLDAPSLGAVYLWMIVPEH